MKTITFLVLILGLVGCNAENGELASGISSNADIASCPRQYPGSYRFPMLNGASHNDVNRTEYDCNPASGAGGANFAYYSDHQGYLRGAHGFSTISWEVNTDCEIVGIDTTDGNKWFKLTNFINNAFGAPVSFDFVTYLDSGVVISVNQCVTDITPDD